MSDTDNNDTTQSTPYLPGTAGTISGFGPPDISDGGDAGQVSFSIQELMTAIRSLQSKIEVNYGPEVLQKLVLDHISDFHNPHRDTFSKLGFNVAKDLAGSILPGSVPCSAPIYAIDPLSIIPNNNLPNTLNIPGYIPDLAPTLTAGSDKGEYSQYLLYNDEKHNPVNIGDFTQSTSTYGYQTVPVALLDIGTVGLLNQSSLTIYPSLPVVNISSDSNTTISQHVWSINNSVFTNRQKVLPTLSVKLNTTQSGETSFLWYSLMNMALNSSQVFIIFTTSTGYRLVVQYTKNSSGYPPTVDVVYKKGYIEPLYKSQYSIGGIRFNGNPGDSLTIQYTQVGTNDWSSYTSEDIGYIPTAGYTTLPSTDTMKFIGGNPDFLLPFGKVMVGNTPNGLMTFNPSDTGTTSSLSWSYPKLSALGWKGLLSFSVYLDKVVSSESPLVCVFSSDSLRVYLTISDDGTNVISRWDIWAQGNNQIFTTSIAGYGTRLQCIALSFDGTSFRGRVSGSDGVFMVPCSITPDNLNNATSGNFTGAILNLEVYDAPDNGYVLDFLVGDGPRPSISTHQ